MSLSGSSQVATLTIQYNTVVVAVVVVVIVVVVVAVVVVVVPSGRYNCVF